MKVTERSIDTIQPYHRNAKLHPDKQVKQIADSIAAFGFNQPIVVDKQGVIIVGHGRYLAAKSMNMSMVPVLELDIDEEKAKAYRLADNKLNESEWDMELVLDELKTLSLQNVDLTGFDKNLILETEEDRPNLGNIGQPKTEFGDVYELGAHRLVCGDSQSPASYEQLLGEERPRLVFTDPPYSIDYHSVDKSGKQKGGYSYDSEKYGGTGGRIFNDDKTPAEALEFYKAIAKQIHAFTSDDMTLYWWYATRLTDINMQALREEGFHFSQIVMWLKEHLIFSPGQLYHRIYEPCMVLWKEKGTPHYQNFTYTTYSELWTTGDIKNFAEALDVWYQKRDNTSTYIHPTQKPIQLAERAIKRSSALGDTVLDCFGGSGSTLMACDQLERKARLIELDPKYCDAIVTRYLQAHDATHVVKNGKEILW